MIVFSHWYGGILCGWGFLIALYLRFDVCEDIINQTCSLTGTAVFLVC
jgi:hypothetical protein